MPSFEKVKKFLEELRRENIKFKQHAFDKIKDRPIDEGLIRTSLKKPGLLLRVDEQPARRQGEEKYKLWLKLSNKYSLVVIVAIAEKDLYIITSWNTDRKWQKQIQK